MATHPNRNSTTPEGYDSIVLASDFIEEGCESGLTGTHYDYQSQCWVDGHDHAHVDEACALLPLYCGADLVTCQGTQGV